MKLFILSKLNQEMSIAEASSVLGLDPIKTFEGGMIAKTGSSEFDRLAYTKGVYEILFSSDFKGFQDTFMNHPWADSVKGSFCVRSHTPKFDEKMLAGYVWHKLKKPKVRLEDPDFLIEIFEVEGKFHCCNSIWQNKGGFEERKAHLRPKLVPVSLDPRLARALVNLTGIRKGKLLDPFCGTGGILIETGLIGIKPVGIDINPWMVKSTNENLKFYKIKGGDIKEGDALLLNESWDYIVTDLPYGKNTGKIDTNKLYKEFMSVLGNVLRKRAVIVFPKGTKVNLIAKGLPLKIIYEFDYYIHKSMSKRIVVLEKIK